MKILKIYQVLQKLFNEPGRFLFVLLIPSLIVLSFCKKIDDKGGHEEYKDGIKTIYNPATPLNGKITLKLKKLFTINATEVDDKNPPGFGSFDKDKNGCIYINDYRNSKILKFDRQGKFLLSFGRKGEGPGEFSFIKNFKVFEDKVIVWGGRKFSTFDIDGKFIEEKKVKKYYYPVVIAGEKQFIVIFNKETEDKKSRFRVRINALIDSDENVLTTLFKAKDSGSTTIKKKDFVFSFYSPRITKDIKTAYNVNKKLIYINLSNEYKIFVKKLDGKLKYIIERKFKKIEINDDDKKKIVKDFQHINDWQKKIIGKNLPPKFCVISGIKSLPENYLLISVIKGSTAKELDIFDNNGRFIYMLEYPENISFYSSRFVGKKLFVISEGSESDSYIEYEIINYNKIFKR